MVDCLVITQNARSCITVAHVFEAIYKCNRDHVLFLMN